MTYLRRFPLAVAGVVLTLVLLSTPAAQAKIPTGGTQQTGAAKRRTTAPAPVSHRRAWPGLLGWIKSKVKSLGRRRTRSRPLDPVVEQALREKAPAHMRNVISDPYWWYVD